MKFDISVVVPFTPSEKHLNQTLLGLESQHNINFEVLIVANPQPARFPLQDVSYPLQILRSEKGANSARNLGLEKAQADLVVFLDADCIPLEPDFLFQYHKVMTQNPHLTGAGGVYTIPQNVNKPTQAYHFLQIEWLYRGLMSPQLQTENLLGGNLILRKSKLKNEKFDSVLKFGGTEREFLFRLYLKGHLFQFWPSQKVIHKNEIYFFDLARKAFAQGKGAAYIQEKLGDEISHDLYLKRPSIPQHLIFAIQLYDFFFQIGRGRSIFSFVRQFFQKEFHQFFSALLITKSIQKSRDRSV